MAKAKWLPGGPGGAALTAAFSLMLSVTGCQLNGSVSPSPTPSGEPPRPFTVMSTDLVRVTDPAAITDAASAVVSLNVFQRLMTADPGQSVLKPDAARDCIFTSTTIYSCTLNEGLTFHNGHALTASDVKFSIQRATRLNVAGSSTSLLSSLRQIDTPDEQTVRFRLSRPVAASADAPPWLIALIGTASGLAYIGAAVEIFSRMFSGSRIHSRFPTPAAPRGG